MKKIIALIMALIIITTISMPAYAAPVDGGTATAQTGSAQMPEISTVLTIRGGLKPVWTAYKGAAGYRLFVKNGDTWKKVADTTDTFYPHKNLTDYAVYIYTVRAMDKSGKYIGGLDTEGFRIRYLPTPKLIKAENVYKGVKFSWEPVKGAVNYRVYIKTGAGWQHLAYTSATSYIDHNVTNGKTYTYTVRVCNADGNYQLSFYNTSGVSVKYLSAPVISGFTPLNGATRIKWSAISGAVRYRVFVKESGSWVRLGVTDKTYFDHSGPVNGRDYVYTVRAMDKNNAYITGYDPAGSKFRYIAPPKITKITKAAAGVNLYWKAVSGVSEYLVYRREFGKNWTYICKTPTTAFCDEEYPANTLCGYTLRCAGSKGQAISYYSTDTQYYYNGTLANGKYTVGGSSLVFADGYVRQGFVTVSGKMYYYNSAGVIQKNGLVGSNSEGYRYADKNGVIDLSYTGIADNAKGSWYVKDGVFSFSYRCAVTWGGYDWNIIDGRAYQVSTYKDQTLFKALKLVSKLTTADMSKAQKLRKSFDYLQTETSESSPRVPHLRTLDWPIIYANDIFDTKSGNCLSYAASFAFMAKAIGYEEVYAVHSGGHGWTEIGGLVYDSEWQRNDHNHNYFGISYNSSTPVDYASVKASFASGGAWMHVKI